MSVDWDIKLKKTHVWHVKISDFFQTQKIEINKNKVPGSAPIKFIR